MRSPRIRKVLRDANYCESNPKNEDTLGVMDELFEKRVIVLDREFTEQSCAEVIAKIILLNLKTVKKPIIILINSPGGEVYSMFGVIDVIENSRAPVYTVCTGMAASAAADLLVSGHKRFALPNSTIMIHEAWYQHEHVTHTQLLNQVQEYERQMEQCMQLYIRKTGLSRKKLQTIFSKDSFFTAKDALALNIIDEIGWDIHQWVK
jgi:ATP-dependent Clp protease protease subunit